MEAIGGKVWLYVNGENYSTTGSFKYSFGSDKREMLVGADGSRPGYKSTPQVPFIEGSLVLTSALDARAIQETVFDTIVLELENEKHLTLSNAIFAADGSIEATEGTFAIRFEGQELKEI